MTLQSPCKYSILQNAQRSSYTYALATFRTPLCLQELSQLYLLSLHCHALHYYVILPVRAPIAEACSLNLSYQNMISTRYTVTTRFSNMGKHIQQSRGIGLLIPSTGNMARKYMTTNKGIGYVSPAGRIKNSHIILRPQTELLSSTSKRTMRS